jgi:stress response protein SCP2
MGQRLKTEKMKKSDLDHNALIFKKTQKVCDDNFFVFF